MSDRMTELKQRFTEEPYARTCGATLAECGIGEATLHVGRVPECVCIVGGIAQGGYTASLADYAGVYAAMSVLPEGHTPCTHIAIDLLRPVRCGDSLVIRGKVLNESKTGILVQVTVNDLYGKNKLKAVATMRFAKPHAPAG